MDLFAVLKEKSALIGLLYVFLARRDKLDDARKEIIDTGDAIHDRLSSRGVN